MYSLSQHFIPSIFPLHSWLAVLHESLRRCAVQINNSCSQYAYTKHLHHATHSVAFYQIHCFLLNCLCLYFCFRRTRIWIKSPCRFLRSIVVSPFSPFIFQLSWAWSKGLWKPNKIWWMWARCGGKTCHWSTNHGWSSEGCHRGWQRWSVEMPRNGSSWEGALTGQLIKRTMYRVVVWWNGTTESRSSIPTW